MAHYGLGAEDLQDASDESYEYLVLELPYFTKEQRALFDQLYFFIKEQEFDEDDASTDWDLVKDLGDYVLDDSTSDEKIEFLNRILDNPLLVVVGSLDVDTLLESLDSAFEYHQKIQAMDEVQRRFFETIFKIKTGVEYSELYALDVGLMQPLIELCEVRTQLEKYLKSLGSSGLPAFKEYYQARTQSAFDLEALCRTENAVEQLTRAIQIFFAQKRSLLEEKLSGVDESEKAHFWSAVAKYPALKSQGSHGTGEEVAVVLRGASEVSTLTLERLIASEDVDKINEAIIVAHAYVHLMKIIKTLRALDFNNLEAVKNFLRIFKEEYQAISHLPLGLGVKVLDVGDQLHIICAVLSGVEEAVAKLCAQKLELFRRRFLVDEYGRDLVIALALSEPSSASEFFSVQADGEMTHAIMALKNGLLALDLAFEDKLYRQNSDDLLRDLQDVGTNLLRQQYPHIFEIFADILSGKIPRSAYTKELGQSLLHQFTDKIAACTDLYELDMLLREYVHARFLMPNSPLKKLMSISSTVYEGSPYTCCGVACTDLTEADQDIINKIYARQQLLRTSAASEVGASIDLSRARHGVLDELRREHQFALKDNTDNFHRDLISHSYQTRAGEDLTVLYTQITGRDFPALTDAAGRVDVIEVLARALQVSPLMLRVPQAAFGIVEEVITASLLTSVLGMPGLQHQPPGGRLEDLQPFKSIVSARQASFVPGEPTRIKVALDINGLANDRYLLPLHGQISYEVYFDRTFTHPRTKEVGCYRVDPASFRFSGVDAQFLVGVFSGRTSPQQFAAVLQKRIQPLAGNLIAEIFDAGVNQQSKIQKAFKKLLSDVNVDVSSAGNEEVKKQLANVLNDLYGLEKEFYRLSSALAEKEFTQQASREDKEAYIRAIAKLFGIMRAKLEVGLVGVQGAHERRGAFDAYVASVMAKLLSLSMFSEITTFADIYKNAIDARVVGQAFLAQVKKCTNVAELQAFKRRFVAVYPESKKHLLFVRSAIDDRIALLNLLDGKNADGQQVGTAFKPFMKQVILRAHEALSSVRTGAQLEKLRLEIRDQLIALIQVQVSTKEVLAVYDEYLRALQVPHALKTLLIDRSLGDHHTSFTNEESQDTTRTDSLIFKAVKDRLRALRSSEKAESPVRPRAVSVEGGVGAGVGVSSAESASAAVTFAPVASVETDETRVEKIINTPRKKLIANNGFITASVFLLGLPHLVVAVGAAIGSLLQSVSQSCARGSSLPPASSSSTLVIGAGISMVDGQGASLTPDSTR